MTTKKKRRWRHYGTYDYKGKAQDAVFTLREDGYNARKKPVREAGEIIEWEVVYQRRKKRKKSKKKIRRR